jgi:hypothetical protein
METYTVTVNDEKTIEWRNSDGKLHRKDGPAIERADGTKAWYVNGKYHREDGPAIEYADGTKFWYVDGKLLTQEQFLARTKCKPKQASCAGKVVEVDGVKYILVKA